MLGFVLVGLTAMWGAVFVGLDRPFAVDRLRHRLVTAGLLMICAAVTFLSLVYALAGAF